MINYQIHLDAKETYPLARALVFARGDRDSATLQIRFYSGKEPLGEESGCSATLQLLFEGEQEASTYLLVKETQGYSILMEAPLLARSGVVRCAATLYNAQGARLTVGRFTYTVADDLSLPADNGMTQAHVSLIQQALSSIALAYDQIEELQAVLGDDATYAKEMGDYAKEWGDAAKNVVQDVSVTWYTLPGKPSTFAPSSHTHREFSLLQAMIPDAQQLMMPLDPPNDCTSALDVLQALCREGQRAGFLFVEGYSDLPEVSGLLWFFAQPDGSFTAMFSDGLGIRVRKGNQTSWLTNEWY